MRSECTSIHHCHFTMPCNVSKESSIWLWLVHHALKYEERIKHMAVTLLELMARQRDMCMNCCNQSTVQSNPSVKSNNDCTCASLVHHSHCNPPGALQPSWRCDAIQNKCENAPCATLCTMACMTDMSANCHA